MHPSAGVLKNMIKTYETYGSSVVGLMTVPHADISSYGCAEIEPIDGGVVKVTRLVEKPPVDEAPSDLAIMGRYLFTPTIFREIDRTPPGVGGEIQITDAMVQLMDHESMLGWTFEKGRYDTGMKEDYLRAMIDYTLEREDLGPYLRNLIAEVAKREGLT
jgi:UTP--glucose-1-phosphate uridylyltransferase